jgi:hypothetical protein
MIDPAAGQLQYRQRVLATLTARQAASFPAPPPPPLSAHPAHQEETPGPDGIRHTLVARVRAAIAAGYYDHPALWLAAERALLDSLLPPDSPNNYS